MTITPESLQSERARLVALRATHQSAAIDHKRAMKKRDSDASACAGAIEEIDRMLAHLAQPEPAHDDDPPKEDDNA